MVQFLLHERLGSKRQFHARTLNPGGDFQFAGRRLAGHRPLGIVRAQQNNLKVMLDRGYLEHAKRFAHRLPAPGKMAVGHAVLDHQHIQRPMSHPFLGLHENLVQPVLQGFSGNPETAVFQKRQTVFVQIEKDVSQMMGSRVNGKPPYPHHPLFCLLVPVLLRYSLQREITAPFAGGLIRTQETAAVRLLPVFRFPGSSSC